MIFLQGTKQRTAAYCRVSTNSEDQANSLESQKKYFTDYIEKNTDMSLVKIYYDEGISGTTVKNRNGFNEMIDAALNGEIDLIITKEVSRFARNTVDTLKYSRILKEVGVGIIFILDRIDTRKQGEGNENSQSQDEIRLTLMASIAQEESRKTSERVKWGQTRKMEQGVVFGRNLLGYTVKEGKIYVNEEEAETVRLIFHKFVNEGKGTHVIAKELHEEGIKPMRVKEWSNTTILRILKNEKYVGDLLQKKTYTPDFLTHQKKYNRGEEPQVYIKDHHQPIIDRDTWDRTQAELERRSQSAEQKSKHSNRYWCSGKLVCGECGRRLASNIRKRKDGTGNKTWRCYENGKNGSRKIDKFGKIIGCDNGSVSDRTLLSAVGYCLKFVQTNFKEIKNELIEEIKSVQSVRQKEDTKPLIKKLENLKKKKLQVIDSLLEGLITKEELAETKAYYDKEIAEIQTKIDAINSRKEEIKKQTKTIEDYIKEIERIMQFDTSQTELYGSMLEKIVTYKNHTMTVFFSSLPFGIRLSYVTKGKGDDYHSDFRYLGTEEK
ncbi:MAG: recombinase family protein [Ruminococcus sp.]